VGLLMYGTTGRAGLLFQGGFLCIASPVRRSPGVSSGGSAFPANDCTGIYSIDMNAFAAGSLGGSPSPQLIVPGAIITCQWWGRDPGSLFDSTLSDAIEYSVCP